MSDAMADALRRQKQEMADLAKLPVVPITGLIFPNGGGGSHSTGDAMWHFSFRCVAWRLGGGSVIREPIWVRRWANEDEVRRLMEQYKAGAIVRMRARFAQPPSGPPMALLEEVEAVDVADVELLAILDELRQPVTHHDALFGTMTLDRRIDWYECHVSWRDHVIRLCAEAAQPGDLEKSLTIARQLWADQAGWAQRVRDFAVAELLTLKNESWLDQGETAVSAREFVERITLETILVGPEGTFEFGHGDGDLFWGHGIQVHGTLQAGVLRAEIAG